MVWEPARYTKPDFNGEADEAGDLGYLGALSPLGDNTEERGRPSLRAEPPALLAAGRVCPPPA